MASTDSNIDIPALKGKHIVLGISSGIAAYKAPMIVRNLTTAGADVQVVMTGNAHHFVTSTSLQAVSGRPVRDTLWDEAAEAAMGHIELARWADLVLVAPATANVVAKLAHGMADDLLTTLCLATTAPIFIAPAMNQQMFLNTATAANLEILTERGVHLIGPDSGEQACGEDGPGRMSEPDEIVSTLVAATSSSSELAGQKVMITTGPTREAIDPVRYVSNHSSGLQGLSIAEAALRAGAEVLLVAGPGVPRSSADIERIDVESALDMHSAVQSNLPGTNIFIGVAAVADYRVAAPAEQKMKRAGTADASLSLDLVENPDIIASVAKHENRPALVIGFAAETNNAIDFAREKRVRKDLDAIVVNDVSDKTIGFNSSHNAATLIFDDGDVTFPRQSKQQLAGALVRQIPEIFAHQLAGTNPTSVTK